jgi:uncharacterized protein with PIN domain
MHGQKGDMEFCEVRADFQTTHGIETRWKMDRVELVADGKEVRCAYCHGPVRIHRKRKVTGTVDHVEHKETRDAENCRGGHYFRQYNNQHQMSATPVA